MLVETHVPATVLGALAQTWLRRAIGMKSVGIAELKVAVCSKKQRSDQWRPRMLGMKYVCWRACPSQVECIQELKQRKSKTVELKIYI